MQDSRIRELLELTVDYLADEREYSRMRLFGADTFDGLSNDDLFAGFRALVNTRQPLPASKDFIQAQDELLQALITEKGVSRVEDADQAPDDPRIRVWQGNIVTFAADGIVNAANSQMLGCWQPGHHCIDNAIHTFAGIQLRAECSQLMQAQGHEEPTGSAKITGAYNLPAKHVIHTVGPIADGHPTPQHREQLASCYSSSLDLAHEQGLSSIALCGISTGIFGFPREEAARIAVKTVRAWLAKHPASKLVVVFDVYGAEDEATYRHLLGME